LSKDSSFAYAIGRIRAIEKRLLDKGKFDRMIESKTPEEAIKVVAEAGYAESSSFSGNIVDYEIVLKEEERKLFSLLKEISSQSEVFDIFMLKNDYHNIKVILKSEFLEITDKKV
jgi:V/A-type H+-transporting ATPase subunit C